MLAGPARIGHAWGMKACLPLLPLILAAWATPAVANPDTPPLVCGQPRQDDRPAKGGDAAPVAIEAATLAGTYRCSTEGVTVTLRLEADGRFEQRMTGAETQPPASAGGPPEPMVLAGRWRVEGHNLYLFEAPKRPPQIAPIEQKRDPSVALRIEVRTADGKPAQGLFVGEGRNANPRSSLDDDGLLVIPSERGESTGMLQIVRSGDELPLIAVETKPGGPNSLRFLYQPSEVEPFKQRARIADPRGETIIVPFGIGGIALRRTVR